MESALVDEESCPRMREVLQQYVERADSKLTGLLHNLECTEQGLSSEEAARRLLLCGPNTFDQNKEWRLLKFCKLLLNPFSIGSGIILIIYITLGICYGGMALYLELICCILLLAANTALCFLLKCFSDDLSVKQLCTQTPKSMVLRDGRWCKVDGDCLVPGDIICVKAGDVVCADAFLLNGKQRLEIEEYWNDQRFRYCVKYPGDMLFSGSNCFVGELRALVVATGIYSCRGKVCCSDLCRDDQFSKILMFIAKMCTCLIAVGLVIDIVVVYGIHRRGFSEGMKNVLALAIGGFQIASPTFLSVIFDAGFIKLSQLGVVINHKPAIDQLARIDMLLCSKTGVLTINRPCIVSDLVRVFSTGVNKEMVMSLAARASSKYNQVGVDSAICMVMDPKEASDGITEVDFHHFGLFARRTVTTFIDGFGNWFRACKGNPDEILDLCNCNEEFRAEIYKMLDDFSKLGLRALAVAQQVVPERTKTSKGGPWQFLGVLPFNDPLRRGCERLAPLLLKLGVKLKMISGDHLAVVKDIGQRLGMGENIYSSDIVIRRAEYASGLTTDQVEDLISDADGIAGLSRGDIITVLKLSQMKHICGMLGYGARDFHAMALADVRITLEDACDAVKSITDVILPSKDVGMVADAIFTGRAIYWTRKGYTVFIVSTSVHITFSFILVSGIWGFIISPFMVLLIAVLNNTLAVAIPWNFNKLWSSPGYWKLKEILLAGATFGIWLTFSTTFFFWVTRCTSFFTDHFGVQSLRNYDAEMTSALFLQVHLMIQGLLLVTQCHRSCFIENPGKYFVGTFVLIEVCVTWMASVIDYKLFEMKCFGWRWAAVIWCYDAIFLLSLEAIKLALLYLKTPDPGLA